MSLKEHRSSVGLEFRTTADTSNNERIIEGHAAVFNRQTSVGGYFFEVIDSGAFDNTDLRDVALFINHDFSKIPLARSRQNGNSTLTLSVDDIGLAIRAKLDIEGNADARALYSAVERGDLDGMSFAFVVADEEWRNLESDMPTRRIKKIDKIFEISACSYPAYSETDISARGELAQDSAKKVLENARANSTTSWNFQNEIEILKIRNRILGGL